MAHSVGASLPEFKQADVVEMEAEVLSLLGRGEKLKAVELYRDRTQYIIMSNTASLYSCLMYGKGITDDSRFIERALSTMREFMEDDGQALRVA